MPEDRRHTIGTVAIILIPLIIGGFIIYWAQTLQEPYIPTSDEQEKQEPFSLYDQARQKFEEQRELRDEILNIQTPPAVEEETPEEPSVSDQEETFSVTHTPQDGQRYMVQLAPTEVVFTGNAPLDFLTEVRVEQSGLDVALTTPLLSTDKMSLRIPIDASQVGQYDVQYQVCSLENECLNGSYHFEVY